MSELKGLGAFLLWVFVGINIGQGLQSGTFMAEAFPIIWVIVFVVGCIAWDRF